MPSSKVAATVSIPRYLGSLWMQSIIMRCGLRTPFMGNDGSQTPRELPSHTSRARLSRGSSEGLGAFECGNDSMSPNFPFVGGGWLMRQLSSLAVPATWQIDLLKCTRRTRHASVALTCVTTQVIRAVVEAQCARCSRPISRHIILSNIQRPLL